MALPSQASSSSWSPSTPFPTVPSFAPLPPSPFLSSPSPSTSISSTSTTSSAASASPLTVSPLLEFYTNARAWTAGARASLEPESAAPSTSRKDKRHRARGRPYAPRTAGVNIKAEPVDVPLHLPPPELVHAQAGAAPSDEAQDVKLRELLNTYDGMLWERMESCKRLERLLQDSERLLGPT